MPVSATSPEVHRPMPNMDDHRRLTAHRRAFRRLLGRGGIAAWRGTALTQDQRKVIAAALVLVAEHGHAAIQRGDLRRLTALSHWTLLEVVSDVDKAVQLAYEHVSCELTARLHRAARDSSSTAERLDACTHVLCEFAMRTDGSADLWFVAIHQASLEARDRRAVLLAEIGRVILDGETPSNDAQEQSEPDVKDESARRDLFALGGVLELLATAIRQNERERIPEMQPDLTTFLGQHLS